MKEKKINNNDDFKIDESQFEIDQKQYETEQPQPAAVVIQISLMPSSLPKAHSYEC